MSNDVYRTTVILMAVASLVKARMTVGFEQTARCDEPLHVTAAGDHIAHDASSVLSTDAVRSNN